MKKSIKVLFLSLLCCFMLSSTVNAEEAVKQAERTFDNSIENKDIKFNAEATVNKLGAGETGEYAGGYVSGLTQTGATLNTVTLNWTAAYGATGYYIVSVYEYNGYYYPDTILKEVTGTSVTLNLPEQTYAYGIGVIPYDANGYEVSCGDVLEVYTTPKKLSGLKINGYFASSNNLSVVWNDSNCYGFEAYCYNRKGKQVDCVDTSAYHSASFYKTNTQNIYTVKVRPYVYINGSQKLYGDFSNVLYAVPQPKITSKNKDVKLNSVNLKWKKVNGASKYVIYVSSKKNSGYKKVATVKSSKKSYKITKFKGKKLNTKSTKYIKIVTYAKFGKKTVKSQSTPQLSARTYYY